MKIFRYQIDRFPIFLFTCLFFLDLSFFFLIEKKILIVFIFLVSFYIKGTIGAWNHHHQHLSAFRINFLNKLLDIMYGLQTGMTCKAWTLHHAMGHHQNYLDQETDESRWKNKTGHKMDAKAYVWDVFSTLIYRTYKVGKKFPDLYRVYLGMLALQFVILGTLLYINWFNALFLFVLPAFNGLWLAMWATFDHHSGLDTQSPMEASRNIIDPLYNKMTGNLGYHTAHHINQGMHWSKLPELHTKIKNEIPKECYIGVRFPYTWFKN